MLSFADTVVSRASVEATFGSAGAGTVSAGMLIGAASAAGVAGPVSVALTAAGAPGAPGWLRDGPEVEPVAVVLVPLVWVFWVPDVWVGLDVLALVVVEPVPAVPVFVVPDVWVGPDVLSPAVPVAGGSLAGAVTGAGPAAGSVTLV